MLRSEFQPGWLFKDFESPALADQQAHKSARVLNELLDNKPVPTWLNEIEKLTETEDPVFLVDKQGRVGYAITVKSVFDEVFELHNFPFDRQMFDVRVCFESTDKHKWVLTSNPREVNGW